MPIFVGSNSDDSRIRSNRVGFAVSTANPGTASEGDVYFNSSDSGLRAYDGSVWSAVGAGGGTISGIASGALTDGQTVLIQSDGTLAGVSTVGVAQTFGSSETQFEAGQTNYIATAYDSSNNKVVIAYSDYGDGQAGKAVVATITGNTITYGTPVEYASNTEWTAIAYDENAGKVLIAYQDGDSSDYGKAIVGTVSGNSISFGSENTFRSDQTKHISVTYDSNAQKSLITYVSHPSASPRMRSRVATISGTSVSFGTENDWYPYGSEGLTTTFDSTNNKVLVFWIDNSLSERGEARVATISGTDVTFGSSRTFESSQVTHLKSVYDPDQQKAVVMYRSGSNKNVIVATVDGDTNLMSFGDKLINAVDPAIVGMTYDSSAKKTIIFGSGNNAGVVVPVSVVGTAATLNPSDKVTLTSYDTEKPSAVYDSTAERTLMAFKVGYPVDSAVGAAIVYTPAFTKNKLTSDNFLGFSDAAYSDGATATVQVAGAIDDAQTGLTTATRLFVQHDGTLSTAATTPSVFAGTALSGTEIKIKK